MAKCRNEMKYQCRNQWHHRKIAENESENNENIESKEMAANRFFFFFARSARSCRFASPPALHPWAWAVTGRKNGGANAWRHSR